MINLVYRFFALLNWGLNNQWKIVGISFGTAYIIGIFGYLEAFKAFPNEPFISSEHIILSAFWWSFLNFIVGSTDNLTNWYIILSRAIVFIALAYAVIITLLKNWVGDVKLWMMKKRPHTLVFGLGKQNLVYLESELAAGNQTHIVIIEPDKNNRHIEYCRDQGFGVVVGTLENYHVDSSNLKRVIVSAGSDQVNMDIAGQLARRVDNKWDGMVHIHLENNALKPFLQKSIYGNDILFKPFSFSHNTTSFNENAARQLFDKHTILGDQQELVQTSEPFSVAVVGDGELALRIVYHLCLQSALPNRNIMTIHCICENAEAFIDWVRTKYIGIDNINNVVLKAHSMHIRQPEYFSDAVWHTKNLTNVIVCNNHEMINLECVSDLYEKTYFKMVKKDTLKTKIHFAMYNNMELGMAINANQNDYRQFYTFGNMKTICAKEYLVDEIHESLAKVINSLTDTVYQPDMLIPLDRKVDDRWFNKTQLIDQDVNRAQALHMTTKLMSLGLQKVYAHYTTREQLLRENLTLFFEQFWNNFELKQADVIAFSIEVNKYYSEDKMDEALINKMFVKIAEGNSLISKLIRAEHDRWNTYHFLNGWTYSASKDRQVKEHDYLLPFEEMYDAKMRTAALYDVYAIVYIPNYLASAGYKIEKIH